MFDLPGLDAYITAPDYAREDREADLEKAGEYVDRLSAQEIAEEVFYDDAAKARRFLVDHSTAGPDGYPRKVGQYRTAEAALAAVAGDDGYRAYERTEQNGHYHEAPISDAIPEELRA